VRTSVTDVTEGMRRVIVLTTRTIGLTTQTHVFGQPRRSAKTRLRLSCSPGLQLCHSRVMAIACFTHFPTVSLMDQTHTRSGRKWQRSSRTMPRLKSVAPPFPNGFAGTQAHRSRATREQGQFKCISFFPCINAEGARAVHVLYRGACHYDALSFGIMTSRSRGSNRALAESSDHAMDAG